MYQKLNTHSMYVLTCRILWDPMDTATGRVASPVALTPDGRLRPGDRAFSFEGPQGFARAYASSQMPRYRGVKVMLTQEGTPAYMAVIGVLCCAMLCWAGLGWAVLCWAGLGCAVLGCAGLCPPCRLQDNSATISYHKAW